MTTAQPFRLNPVPILIAVLIALGIAFASFVTIEFLKLVVHLPERPEMPWIAEYYFQGFELVYAVLVISFLRTRYPGTYGLQWPEGKSFIGWAILFGLALGLFAMAVDYWPQLLTHRHLDEPYPLTLVNILGWLFYAGVIGGLAQEVMYRGLLVTWLTQAMPGQVAIGRFTMNGAGVVVAAIYALSYSESILNKPFLTVFGQLVYAFIAGVFFAYWYEKSKSLLAPIVGHNVGALVEQGLLFAMIAMWTSPHFV